MMASSSIINLFRLPLLQRFLLSQRFVVFI